MNCKSTLNMMKKSAFVVLALAMTCTANAQLATNPDKFLGNITTRGSVNGGGIEFATLWNQITPENESKWSSVEGTKGSYQFGGVDNCVNYAKSHHFPFKYHCLLWGAQYPDWINNLNHYDKSQSIVNWMDNIKNRYYAIDMIDVVNEALSGHQANTPIWYEPLGGQGATGYDWIVKAFEMAHERWPEAILIYNDFNTFQYDTDRFIDLVTKIRDAGAPIDAYGCQSHDLTDCSLTTFKNSMNKMQNALKMPMYISEYDLDAADDSKQKKQMSDQFPLMWEADYCAGVTLWGYVYGTTWVTASGLIKDGVERPAMTWLREYMATEVAKNVKSPFPGMKKPISLYIKPARYKAPINEPNTITVNAKMHNGKTIEKVELYADNNLVATMTSAPYTYDITPKNFNKINLKAIVYTSDGKTYERLGGFYGSKWSQHPYTADNEPTPVPGIVEAENFDMGGESISYHNTRTSASTTTYREDQENVGIMSRSETNDYYLSPNNTGEWYDYTINITKSSSIKFEAITGTMTTGGAGFTVLVSKDGDLKKQIDFEVPYTGRRVFTNVKGNAAMRLSSGIYKIRVLFNKGKADLDKLYVGVTEQEMGIENVNIDEEAVYTIYSTTGAQLGQVKADNADKAAVEARLFADKQGIYIIKNNTTGKSKSVVIK